MELVYGSEIVWMAGVTAVGVIYTIFALVWSSKKKK